MAASGIKILEVRPESPAKALGLKPGDRILAVNGHEVPDELALKFYLSEEYVDLFVQRTNGVSRHFRLNLEDSYDLGIAVEEFSTHRCKNACLFCFVDQLPPGVRPSLKVKDDDFRLSFLHGNYVTLTNLAEKDLSRILEQRLSPLYISVHATDPELRMRIMGRKKPDNLDKKLKRLAAGNIRIHAQIVLMPGINDGMHLEKTVFDLYRLYPGVQSVAIVPVGLSAHGAPGKRLKPVTPRYSRALVRRVSRWQEEFRMQSGCTFACLADEFYLQAGLAIPERSYYDDFAQIEDGIGMVRDFIDDFEAGLRRRRRLPSSLRGTLVTGTLFFPVLERCIKQWNRCSGSRLKVCEAGNRFLGGRITVAGLLAGADILAALRKKNPGDFVIIPGEALSGQDCLLLDDLTLRDLSDRLGKPVYSGGRTAKELFGLLSKLGRRQKPVRGLGL